MRIRSTAAMMTGYWNCYGGGPLLRHGCQSSEDFGCGARRANHGRGGGGGRGGGCAGGGGGRHLQQGHQCGGGWGGSGGGGGAPVKLREFGSCGGGGAQKQPCGNGNGGFGPGYGWWQHQQGQQQPHAALGQGHNRRNSWPAFPESASPNAFGSFVVGPRRGRGRCFGSGRDVLEPGQDAPVGTGQCGRNRSQRQKSSVEEKPDEVNNDPNMAV